VRTLVVTVEKPELFNAEGRFFRDSLEEFAEVGL